jgi:hypothetical protein
MNDERRYSDEEIAEILERATTHPRGSMPAATGPSTGLTLGELKEIGAEAGIEPDRIEEAAGALASHPPSGSFPTFAGAPRSIQHTMHIQRPLAESEWSRLVADLRETFGAVGQLQGDGDLRTWSNGNLQVHVEPEGTGYRVRMRTLKGDLVPRLMVSGFFVVMAVIMILASVLGTSPGNEAIVGWIFGAVGLGNLGYTRLMLGEWARERTGQFQDLAHRISSLMEDGDDGG